MVLNFYSQLPIFDTTPEGLESEDQQAEIKSKWT